MATLDVIVRFTSALRMGLRITNPESQNTGMETTQPMSSTASSGRFFPTTRMTISASFNAAPVTSRIVPMSAPRMMTMPMLVNVPEKPAPMTLASPGVTAPSAAVLFTSGTPATLEGKAVSLADRIAYVNHDIEDAIRAGLLKADELPEREIAVLGNSSRERINTMITSIYENSVGKNRVIMGEREAEALENLRAFMFDRVYITPLSMKEEERAKRMLSGMYEYFLKNRDKLPAFYRELSEKYPLEQVICDYLSSMTDKFAIAVFNYLYVPRSWALRAEDIEEI